MKNTGASSISLAFIDGESLVWAETFGLADKASRTAPTVDTMYTICSMSKIKIYDSTFKQIETGEGTKAVTLSGGKYYFLFHNTANVNEALRKYGQPS